MMDGQGKRLTANELRMRIGNMDQAAGIRTMRLEDGNEAGVRAARFHTGTGLEFTVLPDRGLDIASASFRGQSLCWRSVTGDVAPQFFEPEGFRWLRNYFGGLLTTCGLSHVGAPRPGLHSALSGRGLHGRVSNVPARNLKIVQEWRDDAYALEIAGAVREASVFGENLRLERRIATELGANWIRLEDTLHNDGFRPAPYMLLYHCNFGWPVVDADTELLAPARRIAPHTPHAAAGQARWNRMEAPDPGAAEQVYHHDLAADDSGWVTVALANPGLAKNAGLGACLRYKQDTLPRFIQWKMMGAQEYVCGLEPSTGGIEGPEVDAALGVLPSLAPGESRRFELEFRVLPDASALQAVRNAMPQSEPAFAAHYRELL